LTTSRAGRPADGDHPRAPRRAVIGREAELARLRGLLRAEGPRLISLCGVSGIGTSSLVQGLVAAAGSDFPDGVAVVDVEAVGEAGLLPAVAAAFGVAGEGDGLAEWLQQARALLVLDHADHADHADDAGEALRGLLGVLGRAHGVRTLACSVRPLGIPGEHVMLVGPLPVPDRHAPLRHAADSASVELYLARMRDFDASYTPSEAELSEIVKICRLVGGWPLLIEAAAALSRLVNVATLATRLQTQPDLLFGTLARPGSGAEYLPSARAALRRTWRQLTRPEQDVLRAAAVFSGSFTLDRVAHVADLPLSDTIAALDGLIELHLLERSETDEGDSRFTIGPPLRCFVLQQFATAQQARPLKTRHTRMVCAVAGRAARLLRTAKEVEARQLATDIHGEMNATLEALLCRGRLEDALRFAGDCAPFLAQSLQYGEFVERLDELLRRSDLDPGPALASALIGYTELSFLSPEGFDTRDLAVARWRRGLEIIRESSDEPAMLHALSVMVVALPVTHDVETTAICVKDGLELARRAGLPRWLARFEAWAGMLAHQTHDLEQAAAFGVSALARGHRCGDKRARLLAGMLLHTLPEPPGDVPGGLPEPTLLLELARELGEVRLQLPLFAVLAGTAARSGTAAESAYWCARALDMVEDADVWLAASFALMRLVPIAVQRGDLAMAAELHGMVANRMQVLAAYLPPRAAVSYRELIDGLRAQDPRAFDQKVTSGAGLTWSEALALARVFAQRVAAERADVAAIEPSTPQPQPETVDLTPRETQVLRLIARGHATKAIAELLGISAHSVSHHTSSILDKIGALNRTQAAIWALRNIPAADG